MTSKSKSKGNRFEYDIRNSLNKVFKTEEFTRTPGSGAIMGLGNFNKNEGLNEATKQTLGSDMICPDWFRFSVECKSYKDSPNHAKIMAAPDSTLDGWIGETLFDALNLNLTPALFFKTTRKGTFVVLPYHFATLVQLKCDNYLMYRKDFVIISLDYFEQYAPMLNDLNEMLFEVIKEWLSSEIPTELINNMKTRKEKKK